MNFKKISSVLAVFISSLFLIGCVNEKSGPQVGKVVNVQKITTQKVIINQQKNGNIMVVDNKKANANSLVLEEEKGVIVTVVCPELGKPLTNRQMKEKVYSRIYAEDPALETVKVNDSVLIFSATKSEQTLAGASIYELTDGIFVIPGDIFFVPKGSKKKQNLMANISGDTTIATVAKK